MTQVKEEKTNLIAVRVGREFTLVDKEKIGYIEILQTNERVNINGKEFKLHIGTKFFESQKIDRLLDSGLVDIYLVEKHRISSRKEDY